MKLNEGQLIKLDIRKHGINGEGIGYYERIAVFVPGAIQKEVVEVEIEKAHDNYALAKLVKVLKKSKKRVLPPCENFSECQNCELQHIDYFEQLKIKQSILEQSMKRYTNQSDLKRLIGKTITANQPYRYLNEIELVAKNTNFGLALGFFKPNTNQFVPVDRLEMVHSEIEVIARFILKALKDHKITAYDMRNKEGLMYHVVIRYFEDSNQASVVLVVKENNPVLKQVANDLIKAHKSIKSVNYALFNPKSRVLLYHPIHLLGGESKIDTLYHDEVVKVSPNAYYPVSKKVFEYTHREMMKYIDLDVTKSFATLFTSAGLIAMMFAPYVKEVHAINYDQNSIQDAIENAASKNIKNIHFYQEHVERVLPGLLKAHRFDCLIMQAPKYGLSQTVIQLIMKYEPNQVIYLSENPSTMAKDMKVLMEKYEIEQLIPVDYYPQTARVDAIAIMEKRRRG